MKFFGVGIGIGIAEKYFSESESESLREIFSEVWVQHSHALILIEKQVLSMVLKKRNKVEREKKQRKKSFYKRKCSFLSDSLIYLSRRVSTLDMRYILPH